MGRQMEGEISELTHFGPLSILQPNLKHTWLPILDSPQHFPLSESTSNIHMNSTFHRLCSKYLTTAVRAPSCWFLPLAVAQLEWLKYSMCDVSHPDVSWVLPLCDAHHPQELVDVIAWVANHPSKDDQDVVNIEWPHDFIGCSLIGWHSFAHL